MIIQITKHSRNGFSLLRENESFQMQSSLPQELPLPQPAQPSNGHMLRLRNVGEYSRTSPGPQR